MFSANFVIGIKSAYYTSAPRDIPLFGIFKSHMSKSYQSDNESISARSRWRDEELA